MSSINTIFNREPLQRWVYGRCVLGGREPRTPPRRRGASYYISLCQGLKTRGLLGAFGRRANFHRHIYICSNVSRCSTGLIRGA